MFGTVDPFPRFEALSDRDVETGLLGIAGYIAACCSTTGPASDAQVRSLTARDGERCQFPGRPSAGGTRPQRARCERACP